MTTFSGIYRKLSILAESEASFIRSFGMGLDSRLPSRSDPGEVVIRDGFVFCDVVSSDP